MNDYSKRLKLLKEQRAEAVEKMKEIDSTADSLKRPLNKEEKSQWNELEKRMDEINPEIERLEKLNEIEMGKINSIFGKKEQKNYSEEYRNVKTGEVIPVFGPNQKMSSLFANDELVNPGAVLRGILTGEFNNDLEKRAFTSGTSGIVLNAPVSSQIIDKALEMSILSQLGIKSFGFDTKTVTLARVTDYPTVAFKAESAYWTDDTNMALDSVTLTGYTAGTIVNCSKELLADSENIESALTTAIAGAIAELLDYTLLFGPGSGQPTGIANLADVQGINSIGALTDYAELLQAWRKILDVKGTPDAWVIPPSVAAKLEGLLASTSGVYLTGPRAIENMKRVITSQIGYDFAGGTTVAIMGAFANNVLLGIRQGIEVSVTDAYKFNYNWASFKATIRFDYNFAHGNQFCILSDISDT